jgi:hypothetical protein
VAPAKRLKPLVVVIPAEAVFCSEDGTYAARLMSPYTLWPYFHRRSMLNLGSQIAAACPRADPPAPVANGRYALLATISAYVRYLRNREGVSEGRSSDLLEQRTRLTQARADLSSIELAELRGELVRCSSSGG